LLQMPRYESNLLGWALKEPANRLNVNTMGSK
jgi:hypothetical protein